MKKFLIFTIVFLFCMLYNQKHNIIVEEKQYINYEVKSYYNVPLSYELQDFIKKKCEQYGVNINTVFAVMKTESNFDSQAISKNVNEPNKSIGLLQLNQNYIKWFTELTSIQNFDIYNIYHNLEGGIAVLSFYQKYWSKMGYSGVELEHHMLNSFNYGITQYKRNIKNINLSSRSYSKKVQANKEGLKECVRVINIKE